MAVLRVVAAMVRCARVRRLPARARAAFVAALASAPVLAQQSRQVDPSPAELAIAVGRFDEAESALFEAANRTPREPSARGALGAFLAARGKFLVGATLLDEALQFGADTVAIEARQMDIYRWTGDYERISGLRTARLPDPLREAFRRSTEMQAGGAASATVALQPNEALGLGQIGMTVNGVPVRADVHPTVNGLVLPSSMELFAAIATTGASGDTTYGVARSITIGSVRLGPVPVALIPRLQTGRIGLDLLSQLTPTFDGAAHTLTVHSVAEPAAGSRLPVLLTFPGVSFVPRPGAAPVALDAPAGRAALRGTRWTLAVAEGAIIVAK